MICPNCGNQNEPNVKFCASCGAPLQQQNVQAASPVYNQMPPQPQYQQGYVPQAAPQSNANGLATGSLVCGILSFIVAAVILGTLGIVLGCVAKSKGCTKGTATAGIICGAIGLGLWLLMLIFMAGSGMFLMGF